ncbi:MAG: hypothetical protein A2171_02535 [Candidatus Levybacteria bacterium RBG_13_35_9]|nr:MAG: hypothetical protein A2171_02535 [Candidatus Levybacteria bacterium RBG_13_35_9]
MNNKNYDIHERIFKFIVTVIKFLNKLPKTQANLIFINQIIRSVSSMGANDQEADGALTKKDFIHGFTLVRKEGKETVFWLRLISELNQYLNSNPELLIREGNEIVAIVSTIIKNAAKNNQKQNN